MSATSGTACFLHSCTMEPLGTRVLDGLVDYLDRRGLFAVLDRVFIHNVGALLDPDRFSSVSDRIQVLNHSADVRCFENATIRSLSFFSRLRAADKILYLHTKGVSYPDSHPHAAGVRDWVDFMLHCLVDHAGPCLEMLDHVDVVGCDYRHPRYFRNPAHFSGNFWWATSRYLATLPVHDLSRRHDAEFWLFRNEPTFVNIHTCPRGHYENRYPPEQYVGLVSARVEQHLANLRGAGDVRVLYGVEGRYLDVTEICHRDLCRDGVVRIPAGDAQRNAVFGDPLPGTVKHVRIGDVTYPFTEDVCYRRRG